MAAKNWDQIIAIVKEVLAAADTFVDLTNAVNSRIPISRTALREGLKRELDLSECTLPILREALTPTDERLSPLAQSVLKLLRRRRNVAFGMLELVEIFDRAPTSIETAFGELNEAGYYLELTDDRHAIMPSTRPPSKGRIPMDHWMEGNVHRYGVVSDSHVANRNSRLDVLNAVYDVYEEEGIKIVLHAGNLVDGEFKGNRSELLAHGVEGQLCFTADNYPRREGIQTDFISANCHEGWWARYIGFDIGRHMHNTFHDLGRDDLVWMGHVERDLALHPDNERAVLRVFHPGDGSAYAISYPMQKHVERWQGGEKPWACIFGHYHKYGANYIREVFCLQPGAACDQTLFMRLKKLGADVGACILEIHLTPYGGIARVKHEWLPFYDRGYYSRIWDYRSMYEKTASEEDTKVLQVG